MATKSSINTDNDNDNTINQIITYRSLYILKKKVDLYKPKLDKIYNKYSIMKDGSAKSASIDKLNEVIKEIMDGLEFNIIYLTQLNKLFIANFLNNEDKQKTIQEIQSKLIDYIKKNVTQYNKTFIQKRLSNLSMNRKSETIIKEQSIKTDNANYPVVEYNKHGTVIKSFAVLKKENTDSKELLVNSNKRMTDNNDKNKKENNDNQTELYIEILPFIIADFIQNNASIALIDRNEEFNSEIYSLFDRNIISRFKEEAKPYQIIKSLINKEGNIKNQLPELNKERSDLIHNTRLYQTIFTEKKKRGESTIVIEDMLEKLIAQRIILDNKINEIQKRNEQLKIKEDEKALASPIKDQNDILNANREKDDKASAAVKDIFLFYSKQHTPNSSFPLLNNIHNKNKHLNNYIDITDFARFCNDFNLSLSKEKQVSLFKRNLSNDKTVKYNEFISLLQDIALLLHNSRKLYLWKIIEKTNESITLMELQELEREEEGKRDNLFTEKTTGVKQNKIGTIDKASILYHNTHRQLFENVSKLKYDFDCLSNKPYDCILNDFYVDLGINTSKEYQKRIKRYLVPKRINETRYKLPNQLVKIKNSIENKELLLMLQNKKKELENELKQKELLEENKLYQIKMEHFLTSHKNQASHSIRKEKEKQCSNITRKSYTLSNTGIDPRIEIVKQKLFYPNQRYTLNELVQSNENDYIQNIIKDDTNNSNVNNANIINDQYDYQQCSYGQKIKANEAKRTLNEPNNIEEKKPTSTEDEPKQTSNDFLNKDNNQLFNDLAKSTQKVFSSLQEPVLRHQHNNSLIQLKQQQSDNLFLLDNNLIERINKSYQSIVHKDQRQKKLITTAESIIHPLLNHNSKFPNTSSIKLNHSHSQSQHSLNKSICSIKQHINSANA